MYNTLIILLGCIIVANIVIAIHKCQSSQAEHSADVLDIDGPPTDIDGPPIHVTLYRGPLDGRELLVGKDTIGYGDDQTGALYYFCPEATARLGRYAFAHQPHPISALS